MNKGGTKFTTTIVYTANHNHTTYNAESSYFICLEIAIREKNGLLLYSKCRKKYQVQGTSVLFFV